ncbi:MULTISPECIES: S16 family serine protease [unclassified Methanoculleus]|uniref:S16 family serine protease n=1 Tax=unclassified Methanoculleus TaxID=2619537 RepID=UPI0025D69B07|nr:MULTISPECIES: S16 family serine protease [unclassified Methanoculleus]MCK9317930.1 peptidase S16 [Methanoculleus sp.]MDD2253720.1 peptidase S16 [Methanoculleus sp.]MDD2787773.1 peptidase S16 [Methanoculleus sp.]MDD3216993.1 peptidase S16 [Methanoculleus sp.]MDD4314479.1 peptidase S16 [Methanoculleus sp.]
MWVREKTFAVLLVLSLVMNVFLLAVVLCPVDDRSPAVPGSGEVTAAPAATAAPLPVERTTGTGTASMQAPVILQKIEVDQGNLFLFREVTEEGAMVNVSVEVVPGKGRVLVQTTPRMGIVFQDAANLAVTLAADHSRADLAASDIIFSIQGPEDVSEIDGPSAGALMTALLLSVLEGFSLNESVTVTGTIDEDGKIGPVGGILEKAEAAAASGKALLILSSENDQVVDRREEPRTLGGLRITRQRPVVVDAKEYLEENTGIRVGYVDTLDDLLAYVRAPATAS